MRGAEFEKPAGFRGAEFEKPAGFRGAEFEHRRCEERSSSTEGARSGVRAPKVRGAEFEHRRCEERS
ncbi:hypothetical protein, partial [Methanoculleus sp.]|uniref:hypothetical protein n=1 Tax=Methanoculleus sp. TaxID=90427 RepID=UPI001BD5F585